MTDEIEQAINTLSEDVIARILEVDLVVVECAICKSIAKRGRINPSCGHVFCRDCVEKHVKKHHQDGKDPKCPTCQDDINDVLIPIPHFLKAFGMSTVSEEIANKVLAMKRKAGDIQDFDPTLDWIQFLSPSHVKYLKNAASVQGKELDLREMWEEYFPSTKIKTCIDLLQEIRNERPGEKTISKCSRSFRSY